MKVEANHQFEPPHCLPALVGYVLQAADVIDNDWIQWQLHMIAAVAACSAACHTYSMLDYTVVSDVVTSQGCS